jgi:hypothetical protein
MKCPAYVPELRGGYCSLYPDEKCPYDGIPSLAYCSLHQKTLDDIGIAVENAKNLHAYLKSREGKW